MHMGAMLEPGSHFAQPVAICARIKAKLLFNRRINKNARDVFVLRGEFNQAENFGLPQRGDNVFTVAGNQI